jgi:hypothetical protein
MYARFARGLGRFLQHTTTLEEAKAVVQKRLAGRTEAFLRMVRRAVFGYPKSPYLPLLELAGCELGDVERMVERDGVEEALRQLRAAGVYATFEEFKGREPMVRGGKTFALAPDAFDNPFLSPAFYAQTGGSTGAGTRVPIDLDLYAAQMPGIVLGLDAHRAHELPMGTWLVGLPATSGLTTLLKMMRAGPTPLKWFTPDTDVDRNPSLKNRLALRGLRALCRWYGRPIPTPEAVPLNQADRIARWMAGTLAERGGCIMGVYVSNAVRICVAARERGLDLSGAVFMIGGEPPTPAKVREITRVGARHLPCYVLTETGSIGHGCGTPVDENDLHFYSDTLALIQHPRRVTGSDQTVDAFNFTTLLPQTPKMMLNVEADDYGTIETRECGCVFGEVGLTTHLRGVRSFRKLTGEGMTLIGTEMIHVLEAVLPARFGGSPLDYQLEEEEDADGFTRLNLIVSPRVDLADEDVVVQTVLAELRRGSAAAGIAADVWDQAKTLRIRRAEPTVTGHSKLLPLHLKRR